MLFKPQVCLAFVRRFIFACNLPQLVIYHKKIQFFYGGKYDVFIWSSVSAAEGNVFYGQDIDAFV